VNRRGRCEKEFGDEGGCHVHFALAAAPNPEGNVAEVWDFFAGGKGAREGVEALA
jgi:hypothetical protein